MRAVAVREACLPTGGVMRVGPVTLAGRESTTLKLAAWETKTRV